MDLLLAAAAIRLAVGAGRRPVAFYLLMASIVALFATDAIYAWFGLYTESGYQPGSGWLEAGWMSFYVLLVHRRSAPVDAGPDRAGARDRGTAHPRPPGAADGGRAVAPGAPARAAGPRRGRRRRRAERRLDRALPARRVAHGRADPPAGTLGGARACPAAGGRGPRDRDEPRRHPRSRDRRRASARRRRTPRSACATSPDDDDEFVVVAAAGGTEDVHGVRFAFSTLQEWKRQRLLENDAYVVKAYESTLREPLAPARSATTARSSSPRCSSGTSCTA